MEIRPKWLIIVLLVAILAGLGYGGYRYWRLREQNVALANNLKELNQLLKTTENNLSSTTIALQTEQEINHSFAGQINNIATTVGRLDKLSKTDPELLKKYSRVYFLNEHYVPAKLTVLPVNYLYDKNKPEGARVLTSVWPYLDNMIKVATNSGVDIKISSGYRGFGTQSILKSQYGVKYGSGANQFSADQGYSEHQLGTTLDLAATSTGFYDFEKTASYAWLESNAYKYGFILSYPKGNKYYVFEPWHWRFVGVALATKLHNDNKYFYDVDQREIDQYLVNLFD